ncbi:MAG TPA: arylsulfatase, partial [Planctomycetaceae bacterium]|nr:arylsulfatase [Planctomycetaceae bacterium]
IVIILADDLGYGDVHCNNPKRGRIPTPCIDRLASQGMRFTDAHSSSSVCSPTRYTLLTGRYHWRTRLQSWIVGPFGKPLIAPDRLTIAGLLKRNGYRTACVGKWHLGWDWPIPDESKALFFAKPKKSVTAPSEELKALWREVFRQPITGGPTTRGFDLYFGTDVPNWPPFCFIENDHTVGIPSAFLPAPLLTHNQASDQGPALPGWTLEPILPTLADRACRFIEESTQEQKPFFLYLPLTAPHTPLAVSDAWKNKSGLNTYADFVMETDAVVGQVLAAIERSHSAQNTLVVFTSDNGCAPYIGVAELERKGHFPSGPFRGYKGDIWEGGHRMPFLVRWPGVISPGSRCDQLVQQSDLIATFAEIVGARLPEKSAEDSLSLRSLLDGAHRPVRTIGVSQSVEGLLAIRQGPWKLIFGRGSGGFSKGGVDPLPMQLYNLADDIGETKNLSAARPAIVAELTRRMTEIVDHGRSTPGPLEQNDVTVDWKRFLRAPVPAR